MIGNIIQDQLFCVKIKGYVIGKVATDEYCNTGERKEKPTH